MAKRYLILIRHAQQDRSQPSHDRGLTELGKRQAKNAAQFLHQHWAGQKIRLESSTKRRCLETAREILDLFSGTQLEINPLLTESNHDESFHAFHKRIRSFLQKWQQSTDQYTIACSHSDWIPEAVRLLCNIDCDIHHASIIEITLEETDEALLQYSISLRRDAEA